MPGESTREAPAEFEKLEKTKRRVYICALASGAMICLLSWWFREPGDTFVAILYPVFAGLLFGFIPIVWGGFLSLEKVEPMMIEILTTVIMTRLFWRLHRGGALEEQLFGFQGGHYWIVGILVVGVFIMLDLKRALISGFIIIFISAVISASGVAGGPQGIESGAYLVRVHLFLVVILALTSAATAMREKLQYARSRADVLAQQATTDLLTKLSNRRGAEEYLDERLVITHRYDRPLSVIMLDIDYFKEVNDTHGHDAGDRLLIAIACELDHSIREADFAARWGGDEFLIVAQETEQDDACILAERIRQDVEESEFEGGLEVTISLGVAEAKKGENKAQLLSRADTAMYDAKANGRNRVEVG